MATSKEIAKTEATVPAIADDVIAEMDAIALEQKSRLDLKEDVRLPQLRLVQPTTQDIGANPGQIWDTFASNALDQVSVVPISMHKTRALFGGSIGEAPACTSPDGVRGYGDPGGDCSRCPHANWRQGGRCQLRFNYLVMVVDEGADFDTELPRAVMMHGTSAKVASRVNTLLLGSKYTWSNVLTLSSVGERNDRGSYRVWDFKRERAATQEEMLAAFRWYKTVGASNVTEETATEVKPPPGDDDIPF